MCCEPLLTCCSRVGQGGAPAQKDEDGETPPKPPGLTQAAAVDPGESVTVATGPVGPFGERHPTPPGSTTAVAVLEGWSAPDVTV